MKNRYAYETIQDFIEELEAEIKEIKALGNRPGGMSAEQIREAFKVDDMLENEPSDHDVFLSDMKNDTSLGFNSDEEYDLIAEEEKERWTPVLGQALKWKL